MCWPALQRRVRQQSGGDERANVASGVIGSFDFTGTGVSAVGTGAANFVNIDRSRGSEHAPGYRQGSKNLKRGEKNSRPCDFQHLGFASPLSKLLKSRVSRRKGDIRPHASFTKIAANLSTSIEPERYLPRSSCGNTGHDGGRGEETALPVVGQRNPCPERFRPRVPLPPLRAVRAGRAHRRAGGGRAGNGPRDDCRG